MTSHGDRSARMVALKAGVEEFLTKPVDRADSRTRAAGLDEYLTKPMQLGVLREVLHKWLPFERNPQVNGEEPAPAPHKNRAQAVLDITVPRNLVGDAPVTLCEVPIAYEQAARKDFDFLRAVGFDVAQGCFVSRPMAGEDLPGWVGDWQKKRAQPTDTVTDFT